MPTVAEQLRAGREAKHLTVQQVADVTKIRTDHVRALEEGDFSVFSAPIYIRGSVKNYATFLKLDLPPVLANLDAELKGTQKFSEPPPLTEQGKSILDTLTLLLAKLNWKMGVAGVVAVVGVIIIAGTVVSVRHHKRSDPLSNLKPAVYQPANAGDVLPLPKH
ncbi:MAG: helix-turn-helix domain-containing protein [Verrucomicrobiota bacterium]|jgi:cytoskeletal protein RodZ